MKDELDWYLSHTGPRVTITTRPDLSAVARAVTAWAYDPEQPREASQVIASLTRDEVAYALDAALRENPLLLSPKKRERQPLVPAKADTRLTALARKRIRQLYPEIEQAERASELPIFERDHPAVRRIFRGCYEGSGGGRPRVPERYPLMLAEVASGLLDVASAADGSGRETLQQLCDEASDCYRLCRTIEDTCDMLRRRGLELCRELRASASGTGRDRMTSFRAEAIEASLAEGNLPYANSEILPVGPYGMQPKWGLDPAVRKFAEDNQGAYEEIDRYGRIAMEWARRIAVRARDVLPPPMPDADADVEGAEATSIRPSA